MTRKYSPATVRFELYFHLAITLWAEIQPRPLPDTELHIRPQKPHPCPDPAYNIFRLDLPPQRILVHLPIEQRIDVGVWQRLAEALPVRGQADRAPLLSGVRDQCLCYK